MIALLALLIGCAAAPWRYAWAFGGSAIAGLLLGVTLGQNPTPLLMRHLPCLVDPACPVDHLRRKRRSGAPPVLNRSSEKGDES